MSPAMCRQAAIVDLGAVVCGVGKRSASAQAIPRRDAANAADRFTAQTPQPIGRLVDVGGYRVRVYCVGQGTPTVVIVGAGASFEWGLVQPQVSKGTRVCAYDHSGPTWSDVGPPDACSLRVREIHAVLRAENIRSPVVLVGHSVGALVARLYAARFPDDVAGVVFVDHAAEFPVRNVSMPASAPPSGLAGRGFPTPGQPTVVTSPDRAPRRVPIGEDPFKKLPPEDVALHEWTTTRPLDVAARQRNPTLVPGCLRDIDAAVGSRRAPLGSKPVVVMHVNSGDAMRAASESPYAALQLRLAALSRNSVLVQVDRSSHYMMLDRPEVVIGAIERVVASVRTGAPVARP